MPSIVFSTLGGRQSTKQNSGIPQVLDGLVENLILRCSSLMIMGLPLKAISGTLMGHLVQLAGHVRMDYWTRWARLLIQQDTAYVLKTAQRQKGF